jgi:EpsI family protein
MKTPQFWASVVLLFSTGVFLHVRGDTDRVPTSRPLSEMPQTIDVWNSTDIPLNAETLEVLGKGVFLNRVYQPAELSTASPKNAPVQLFVGYFPTQRTGQAIHSPQHCLPGAGWIFQSSGTTELSVSGANPITVGDYVIVNGPTKAEVLYWYRSHGRSMASDYTAKLYTFYDSMRYRRTDAALVRVITPVSEHESPAQAHARLVGFAEHLNPLLSSYIPD